MKAAGVKCVVEEEVVVVVVELAVIVLEGAK